MSNSKSIINVIVLYVVVETSPSVWSNKGNCTLSLNRSYNFSSLLEGSSNHQRTIPSIKWPMPMLYLMFSSVVVNKSQNCTQNSNAEYIMHSMWIITTPHATIISKQSQSPPVSRCYTPVHSFIHPNDWLSPSLSLTHFLSTSPYHRTGKCVNKLLLPEHILPRIPSSIPS